MFEVLLASIVALSIGSASLRLCLRGDHEKNEKTKKRKNKKRKNVETRTHKIKTLLLALYF
jgi:hypothetical protein